MQVSKVLSFTSTQPVKATNQVTTNPMAPKPVAGWFGDMFKKTNINDLKEIKTKEGNPRFNKEELKEIKSYIKNEKLDTTTVKHLADTMLDVKSMSQAYLYTQRTKDPMHELGIIKKLAKEYETPYQNWSDKMKEGIHTHIKDVSNGKPMFEIRNGSGTHVTTYGEKMLNLGEYKTSHPHHPYCT